jgi:hypothetical protein
MNKLMLAFIIFVVIGVAVVIILAITGKLEGFCGGKKKEEFCGCGAESVGGSTGVPIK